MKILMMVPLWRRCEVVRTFIAHMEATLPDYCELMPLFVISPEDPEFRSMNILTQGYYRVECDNQPLGFKKNSGLRFALQDRSWDYYMDMGSDDVWTPLLWELYESYLRASNPFFGLRNVYKYSIPLDQAAFIDGYHIGPFEDAVTAMGPGRCIRRDVVEKLFPLWDDAAPFGMDGHSDTLIQSNGYKCTVIDNKRLPVICGLKNNICLTAFEQLEDRFEPVDKAWLKDVFDLYDVVMDTHSPSGFHDSVCRISRETRTIGEAFEVVNNIHRQRTGEKRYANLESYKVQITKRFRR